MNRSIAFLLLVSILSILLFSLLLLFIAFLGDSICASSSYYSVCFVVLMVYSLVLALILVEILLSWHSDGCSDPLK